MPLPPSSLADALRFAAGEAQTEGATVFLLVWETQQGVQIRTYPEGSQAVLRGLLEIVAAAIYPDEETGADDDADE